MARLERKPAERVAAAGIFVTLLAGILAYVFWKKSSAATAVVLVWQSLIGILIWMTALIDLRQSRLAEEEKQEWDRLMAERESGGARGKLFEEDEIQAFSARNRLRILEKYITPIFAFLTAALLIIGAVTIFLRATISDTTIMTGDGVLLSVAGMFGLGFVLFLVATYAIGLSHQKEWRPLRAAGGFMMFTTLFIAAGVAAMSLGYFGFYRPDRVIAYVMLGIMCLVALEMLLNLILDIYRPRVEGVEPRRSYDSRLLSLLSEPGGVLRTVSATLDYQFGFKVSQTWFYRFVEQAIAPLILFQLITLYALTCFVIVGPQEQAVRERFGEFRTPQQDVFQPGLHFKLPWPFDRVYRFPANEVKTIVIGWEDEKEDENLSPKEKAEKEEAERKLPILWTYKHYDKEYAVMVATREQGVSEGDVPVNLLAATSTVRYKVADAYKWYYQSSDSGKILSALCEREQMRYLAGVDLFEIMGALRAQARADLREAIQAAADDADIGVEILGVGIEGMHPPVEGELPKAFHKLVTAVTEKEINILRAESTAVQTVSEAEAVAQTMVAAARGIYGEQVKVAEAEARRFLVQNEAFQQAEEVFKAREYLSALEIAVKDSRKYINAVQGADREVLSLNLEDPAELDLMNVEKFRRTIVPDEPIR